MIPEIESNENDTEKVWLSERLPIKWGLSLLNWASDAFKPDITAVDVEIGKVAVELGRDAHEHEKSSPS